MKQKIAIFLLVVLGWQLLFKAAYVVYWKINQDYIIEEYCINKDKPLLNCNGKCHLAEKLEKLEKAERQKKNALILKLKSLDHLLILKTGFKLNNSCFSTSRTHIPTNYTFSLPEGHLQSVKPPPKFIGQYRTPLAFI